MEEIISPLKFVMLKTSRNLRNLLPRKVRRKEATRTSLAVFAMIKWKSISVEDINFIFFLYHVLTHNPTWTSKHTSTSQCSGMRALPFFLPSAHPLDVMCAWLEGTSTHRDRTKEDSYFISERTIHHFKRLRERSESLNYLIGCMFRGWNCKWLQPWFCCSLSFTNKPFS